jgi:hypothetical protein
MSQIVIIEKEELIKTIKIAFSSYEKEKEVNNPKLYTINQIAKKLNKAHSTIKKLVVNGIIKSTPDGLITSSAIEEYLGLK